MTNLASEPILSLRMGFAAVHGKLDEILDASKFIGRAPSQVVEFIENEVKPILTENSAVLVACSNRVAPAKPLCKFNA